MVNTRAKGVPYIKLKSLHLNRTHKILDEPDPANSQSAYEQIKDHCGNVS